MIKNDITKTVYSINYVPNILMYLPLTIKYLFTFYLTIIKKYCFCYTY